MELSEILQNKIKTEGPISFRDFMEMALYYPSLGYYNSLRNKIGKDGDYYTSPVLSPLFGQMIGKQIEQMWFMMNKKPFTLVEYGAGTGALCSGILNYLKRNAELYENLKYGIIEKSERMLEQQKEFFHEKVCWYNSLNEISLENGCIFSNEVLDNFAVHKVVMKEELMEIFVDYKNGFIEILQPANEYLKKYFKEQDIVLPQDYTTEINLQAIDWLKEIAVNLQSGFILTIDYGFLANDLYSAKRNLGTIICYKNHEINNQPYCNIGQQDITAHVNFSALAHWGKKFGLECKGISTQANFLRSLGLMNYLRELEMEKGEANKKFIFQINKLLIGMRNKFKVLIQQKGIKNRMLTGMQFAEPAP